MVYDKDSALRIAGELLRIKAVKLQPQEPFTWASGWKSPIYCDNRKTLSFPTVRTYIRQRLAEIVDKEFGKPDVIAGIATGGIPQGVLVAQELGLPFIYIRSNVKDHGLGNLIEGTYEAGQNVVVVEDLISTGGSSLQGVQALKDAGLKVKGLVAIFSYGFQTATHADRLRPITWAPTSAVDRLTNLASTRDVVRELLTLSKHRMVARSSRPAPIFVVYDFVFLSSKGLHIHSQKCKHLRDQRLGPFEVLEKVGLKSYKLKLPHGCRLHLKFHCDLLSKASNSTPLRHQPAEIESDHNEYAIDYISDVKIGNCPYRRGPYLQFFNIMLDTMSLSGCYLNK
jgi:orotate phosphoribosyltransferase